jgi:hypothetical protein
MCGGMKAVDFIILDGVGICWLLEVKDYRQHPRTKVIDLADEVAAKVRDTLAGLVSAKFRANDSDEQDFATTSLAAKSIRIVLHLEQPAKHSKLFPRAIKPADVLQRLKSLAKAIDPHPRIVEASSHDGLPWSVLPTTRSGN